VPSIPSGSYVNAQAVAGPSETRHLDAARWGRWILALGDGTTGGLADENTVGLPVIQAGSGKGTSHGCSELDA